MRLFLNLILSVSLTGTIPFCIYLLLKKWFDYKICAVFKYNLLKSILICFVIPFSLLKSVVSNMIHPTPTINFSEYIYLDDRVIQTADGYHLRFQSGFYKTFFPIWIICFVCIICYYLYHYFRFKHNIIQHLRPDISHQDSFTAIKEELGLKRPISLLHCDDTVSPFTYGIFHPCIVLTSIVPEEAVSMTIRHELQHIRSYDFLFRVMTSLVVLLHCWNPVIYLFWKEFCEIQEIACDEKLTEAFSPNEVRRYGYYIINIAENVQQHSLFSTSFVQNGKKTLNRRISHLRVRPKKLTLAGIFLCIICLLGFCIPTAACSPEILYLDVSSSSISASDWIYIELSDENALVYPEDESYFQYTDQYILLEDGNILDYSGNDLSKERVACSHSWQKATLKNHQKDGKGGCTVFTYSVYICTKCTATKNKILINENHYIVCPH